MNRPEAKAIVESGITVGQIKAMLKRAYDAGAVNESQSKVNPSVSNSVTFNIFWKACRDENESEVITGIDELGARNVLREFGDYWEGYRPPKRESFKPILKFHHEQAMNIYEE